MAKREQKDVKDNSLSFTKKIVLFLLINAELQTWASYILAYLDKVEVVKELSIQVVITILGAVATYFIKSLVENISKYSGKFAPVNFESDGNIITDENYNDAESYGLSDIINEFSEDTEDYRDYDDNINE